MKRFIILSAAMMLCVMLSAQTQQGYVKTKGRMVDGQLVPGQGLKGATVCIKGKTAVLVKADNGAFSFPVTEAQFRVDSVRKNGYQLVDMDALSKTYKPSANPIYLVMETPEQQLQDQLAAERRIRRTLTNQLHQKEDEIEALKEQQRISDEEYRQALQKLYEETDQNEQLVKDMVERYSTIDYDQLSEFDQKISELILNGELIKADSMLRTKGDINERVEQYRKHEAINAKEKEELTRRQASLKQSETAVQMERDDLANDCYRKFEIFKMQHLNDSAAYYIELRAELDTTNVEWLLETGGFVFNFLSDIDRTNNYYNNALSAAQSSHNPELIANCYNDIGYFYSYIGEFEKAIDNLEKSIETRKLTSEADAPSFTYSYCNLGFCYARLGQFDKALELFDAALKIRLQHYGERNLDVALSFNNIGAIQNEMGRGEEALKHFNKALEIQIDIIGETSQDVATTYNNIASAYYNLLEYESAIEYEGKALHIYETLFGDNHPETAIAYLNLCLFYNKLGNSELAVLYGEKALAIYLSLYGENNLDVAICYNNIGTSYEKLQEFDKALSYANKALSIKKNILGENHPSTASSYNNVGSVFSSMGQDLEAIDFYSKALSILLEFFGERSNMVSTTYANIGFSYENLREYDKALKMYNQALLSLPDEHPNLLIIQQKISAVQAKLKEQENKQKNEE